MTTIEQMAKQFRLLTDWYHSVLEGITTDDGRKIVSEHTNSLEWLAGHLLVSRGRNIARLGQHVAPFAYVDAFVDATLPPPNFRPFAREQVYPSLVECTVAWARYSTVFLTALTTADDHILQTEIPLQGPTGGNTVHDLLTSVVLHEAFHLGQMSLIRKALGYQAMYWFQRPENS